MAQFKATPAGSEISCSRHRQICHALLLVCVLLISPLVTAQSATPQRVTAQRQLEALTTERQALNDELDQYRKTLAVLHQGDGPPEQNSNPAVRKLAEEMVAIRERLVTITEREVTLLQEQLSVAETKPGPARAAVPQAMESKPLRTYNRDYSMAQEAENVARLRSMLTDYYTELQEAARTLPTQQELERRAEAQREARMRDRIPFSVDKVHLNGAEGSTALGQITDRLSDPNIAESRRDIAPICSIRTHLYGSLVGSESRSLQPVGKNHYVARIRLQPGDTTLRVLDHRWEVRLPRDTSTREFLVTLYKPPGNAPELHVVAIDELLAEDSPHIPAWLPDELNLKSRAG